MTRRFKVFAYVCLRAGRADGCLEFERDGLAREVGKSRSTLGRCLRELAAKGVCEWEAAPNQHRRSWLRVRPEYWPYEVQAEAAGQEPDPQNLGLDASAYVAEVRRMFRKPACVQGLFGPADERLATDWHRAGVPLETVRRAILLGSVRKSMSLLDRPGVGAGAQPALFRQPAGGSADGVVPGNVLAAPGVQPPPMRAARGRPTGEAPGSACPDLEQADPSGAVRKPSSAAGKARKETG